jgi:hypothetical protein
MVSAILNGTYSKSANTHVQPYAQCSMNVFLHRNRIAQITPHGVVYLEDEDWQTVTTKRRLNAIADPWASRACTSGSSDGSLTMMWGGQATERSSHQF